MYDSSSLDSALAGVDGVFSVQLSSPPDDIDSETRTGRTLLEAAHRAQVRVIVHSSVARAGEHEDFIGWDEGRWEPTYWTNKAAVNEIVKTQDFPHWVILKPAMIMENMLPPVAEFMFPTLSQRGELETAIEPDTRLDWVAAQDIGSFAAAAFAGPERFHGHEIDLAAESVTMSELAARMSDGTGKRVLAISSTEDELVSRGLHAGMVRSQVWDNVEGYTQTISQGHLPARNHSN